MLFYIVIFFTIFLMTFLEVISNNKKFSLGGSTIILVLLFILSFVRWECGTDWYSYLSYFNYIIPWENMFNDGELFEPGFVFINHLSKSISDSYTFFLFIQATILYTYVSLSIYKLSHYYIFSIFTFYCMSFGGVFFVRQTIAMAILLYSITYIVEKKKLPFIITVLLATLIHRTSFIFLLSYPIFYKEYSVKQIILTMSFFTIIGVACTKLLLNSIVGLNLGILSSKLGTYLAYGSDENYTNYSSTANIIRGLLNRGLLIVIYLYILNFKRKKDYILNGMINLNLFGVILYVLFTPLSASLGRITVYFDIIQIFIIPYMFRNMNIKNKLLLLNFIFLYFLLRLVTVIYSFPDEYIPYKTFF